MSQIVQHIEYHADASPGKPAIMLPDRVITFGMIQSGVNSVQETLDGLKLDRARPVGIFIDSPARHLIVAIALMKSGFASISLRPDLVAPASAVGMGDVITDKAIAADPRRRMILCDERWFTRSAARWRPVPIVDDARIVRVTFTSGSTGVPKAVAVSHRALLDRIAANQMAAMGCGDRVMIAYGLSGNAGFAPAMQILSCGNTVCFARSGEILPLMIYARVDELRGSVAQVRTILGEHVAAGNPIRLRKVSAGGAYLPPSLAEDLRRSFGCEVVNRYASEEAGRIGLAAGSLLAMRPSRGNCFRIVADVEIVSDDGEQLDVGLEGQIRVRSAASCFPFSGDLIETRDPSREWIYPGDVGHIEHDGLLAVSGRVDEVINLDGVKVSPERIEALVRQYPGVDDAAALRMTGGDGQQQAWLFIVGKRPIDRADMNAWIARSAAGELASFRFNRVEMIEDVPRTPTSKIARSALRSMFADTGR